jgi:hypothetical protein
MNKTVIATILSMISLQACVVAPPPPVVYRPPAVIVQPAPIPVVVPRSVVVPPGVVYVAPNYAAPAVGYAWEYHARFGWGWRHPNYGWHRGWH